MTEKNGPTAHRLYQSVADAYFKLMGDDTAIQVMGGGYLKVLCNMREIEADRHGYLRKTDLATILVSRVLSEEIAIHEYEFKQDKGHKRQVVEVRQVGTRELTDNHLDVLAKDCS